MELITRENVKEKVSAAISSFLDGRAESIFRANIDLMNLSSELAHLKYQTEVDLVRLECEERLLFIEAVDKHLGGTGKEREAKAYLEPAYIEKRQAYEETVSFARYLGKILEQLSQLEESIRYRAALQNPQGKAR